MGCLRTQGLLSRCLKNHELVSLKPPPASRTWRLLRHLPLLKTWLWGIVRMPLTISFSTLSTYVASSSAAAHHGLIREQEPDLLGGTLLMDSDSYTTRVRLHGGPTATLSLLTTALLDTGFPASFVNCRKGYANGDADFSSTSTASCNRSAVSFILCPDFRLGWTRRGWTLPSCPLF